MHIPVSENTYDVVVKLRSKLGVRTWDEFMTILISEFDRCVELRSELMVRKVVCNDLKEARATLPAWLKLLSSKLGTVDMVVKAVEYLRPDPNNPNDLIVDSSKCTEVNY